MTILLSSFLIAALGLLAIRFAGRRTPVLTLITLSTLLTLPLLTLLPKLQVELPTTAITVERNLSSFIPHLYLAGLALFSLKLLLDLLAFQRWKNQSSLLPSSSPAQKILQQTQTQLNHPRTVQLRLHPHLSSPVAAGLFKPTIYLPQIALTWSPETLHCVLLHELGHHARRDLHTALAARLACLLHWFNPLAWLLRKHLLAQCEFACDQHVLATGLNPKTYAHTLCDLAQTPSQTPALAIAMASSSGLRDRVENLLSPRKPLTLLPIAATLALTFGTALALSTLQPIIAKTLPQAPYSPQEIELRLSANPFPGN